MDKPLHRNNLRPNTRLRRGYMLIGCLTVLAIVLVLAIIATIYAVRSYRGWVANGVENTVDTLLVQMQLDEEEQGQVMGHVNTLMTRYRNKEIGLEDLGQVLESITDSPLLGEAILTGMNTLYISKSGLPEDEKTEGRLQLARYSQGLREKSISTDTLETVLASVSTTDPDGNDIQLQYQQGPLGSSRFALRSADEVSEDDLRALFAEAKSKADEAGVVEHTEPIDISDTLGIAIANALGDDPGKWVPGYEPGEEEKEVETKPLETDTTPPPSADDEPNEEDGP